MAHLVVSPLATSLWEAISSNVPEGQRPAFLDQTDGVGHSRTANYEALIAVAETVKEDLDMTAFSVDRLGTDAMNAVSHISARTATFKDAVDLQSLFTTYVNLHDTLLQRLGRSGKSKEEGTLERRMECFDSFVGEHGRSKNLGLFYCFIVWEGQTTRWATRRLDSSICVSSTDDPAVIRNSSSSRSGALTKKQLDTAALVRNLREVLHTPAESSSLPSSARGSLAESDVLINEKKRLFEDKSNTERQTKRSMRSEQLEKAMASKGYEKLSKEQQDKLQADWFASLAENDDD